MVRTVRGYKFKFFRVPNDNGHKVNTVCEVYIPGHAQVVLDVFVAESIALLHPKDACRFDKKLGKIIALGYALKELPITRKARKKIFDEMFS